MPTKQEIIAALTARARRCEIISSLYADGDRLGQLQFLAESIASLEAAKMIDAQAEWAAPHLLAAIENARARGRAQALRKQPRPRRASAQHLLRFAQSVTARLRAEQIAQASNN